MPCDTIRDYEWEREIERQRQAKRKEEIEKEKRRRRQAAEKKVKAQAAKAGWVMTQLTKSEFIASKPYSTDKLEIKILDTGTVRVSSGKISAANHVSAETFLHCIQTAIGGKVTVRQKLGTVAHSHGGIMHTH